VRKRWRGLRSNIRILLTVVWTNALQRFNRRCERDRGLRGSYGFYLVWKNVCNRCKPKERKRWRGLRRKRTILCGLEKLCFNRIGLKGEKIWKELRRNMRILFGLEKLSFNRFEPKGKNRWRG
jgi:hypothetical protein